MGVNLFFKVLIVIFAYLLGSVPTAYILFRIKKGGDIREYGSGNVGATNIIRTVGTGAGIFTIFCDILKGFLPVLLVWLTYREDLILLAVVSVAAILGHDFPVYIRFRGGKAIATSYGVVVGICVLPFVSNPLWMRMIPMFAILATWGIFFAITRIVSSGSLAAAVVTPLSYFFAGYPYVIVIGAAAWALLTFITHRKNIVRLIRGEEKKIKGRGE